MAEILRVIGILMMLVGALIAGTWFIEPLRQLWPLLFDLPLPIRIGLGVAATGLLVVFGTVLHERIGADPESLREVSGTDEPIRPPSTKGDAE